jgi:hypothetical protein
MGAAVGSMSVHDTAQHLKVLWLMGAGSQQVDRKLF